MTESEPSAAGSPQPPAPEPGAAASDCDTALLFVRIQRLKYLCWGAYISRDKQEAAELASKLRSTAQALESALLEESR